MLVIVLCAAVILLYAWYETFCLKEKHFSIDKENNLTINEGETGNFKIAHISDIHFSRFYSAKRFAKVVEAVNQQEPDLLIFTGDLIEDFRYWQKRDSAPLIQQLSALKADKGKFAILGNHDYQSGGRKPVEELLINSGFVLLDNRTQLVGALSLTGMEDSQGGSPDYALTPSPADFSILLLHEPDQVDQVQSLNAYDLVLAGHSHGGQLRLPLLNYRNHGSKSYWTGIYPLSKTAMLVVNTGIGTTGPPLRFRVKPEILYFHLQNVYA
ncbi:metallophosphoesterase [Enterococcus sp. 669A]|uniref:Metallophosphoesterase n=1 Tax=Candidatus Enterococcus moelleringii TaxID=2815325 RepID=A0ABS3L5K7_9ENTE|nr:metallophosphoesterase [Enterococcus sp. 669A]MBO1304892.1 metallophosphoesterase [Enterococcus sp. 669A]